MISRAAAALAVLIAAGPAAAQHTGDAAAGHELAAQFCSSCHIVGAERVGSDAAPPFQAIADDPERTFTELHAWRGPMHPVLKSLALTPEQIADVNAYLDSLRRPEGTSPPPEEPPPPIENAPPEKVGPPIETQPE